MDFPALFKKAVDDGASDIHLRSGRRASFRVNGELVSVGEAAITSDEFAEQLKRMVPAHMRENVSAESIKGLDFSYTDPAAGRFRCSAFRTLGRYGMVMRTIKSAVPSLEALHLPSTVMDIALSQRGLTLVTGTTGSGKSTTLAAMIDLINNNYDVKIITVEDPIEYLHDDKRALITQIEVGSDSTSFDQALRQSLRQDPDVILIGELRDVETLRMALRAADTGHQVFATVHASRAAQTIERIIAMFPPADHKVLLSQLAHSLEAIISQRLVVAREDKSRRPAIEILRGGPVTEKYILEGKLAELTEYIEGGQSGMQSFDQHLLAMYKERLISGTEALKHANRPEALATAMRGIKYTGRPNG
ncbi:MAG: PilT/PilU family type 4a pilus ATPase [Anaerolineae bacterium]|nr:PilT/PilU family type 4a pilus ATPase [Phycisphaerae bacterium]